MMMDWSGRNVVVIGAARQGIALARFLSKQRASVLITDQRPADQLQSAMTSLSDLPVEWVCGSHPLSLLDRADLVCPSGGVSLSLPFIQEAIARGIPLSNDSQIFLEMVPCRVVGITGSAGKTTTTTLVGRIAQFASEQKSHPGRYFCPGHVWIGGNIGIPLITFLETMGPDDLAVMELSSFQLEIMTLSPHVAAILNITPNHLDRHKTMEAYAAAKAHILKHPRRGKPEWPCEVVLGCDDPVAWGLRGEANGRVWSFGRSKDPSGLPSAFVHNEGIYVWDGRTEAEVMPRSSINLRGEHNMLNVLAACAICSAANLSLEAMRQGVEGFSGVAHRLEFVRNWGGADWYNDSIATAPERSIAGVRSFTSPIVLLAGGRDKDLPWQEFSQLVRQRVDHLILFGEAAPLICQAVGEPLQGERPYTLEVCEGLKEAVQAAARLVESGDIVLLSPGGTSFDEFRDFEERGEAFCKWVHEL